jgi:hypothetical protein
MSKVTGIDIKAAALSNDAVFSRLESNTQSNLRQFPEKWRTVVRVLMYAFCITTAISAGAEIPLYDTNQAKKVGISDFEQGMKVSNDAIITGLRLEYASGATGNSVVADKPYTNLLFSRTNLAPGNVDMDAGAAGVQSTPVPARTLPLELSNSKLFLYVNGQERYNCDIKDFFIENDRKDYMSGDPVDFKSLLEQLVIVPKGGTVEVRIKTAEGVAVPSNVNHFFRWSLMVSALETV